MLLATGINPVFMLRQALPLLHLFRPPGRVVATKSTTSKHHPYLFTRAFLLFMLKNEFFPAFGQ
jgi:hypothetical protein